MFIGPVPDGSKILKNISLGVKRYVIVEVIFKGSVTAIGSN